jgi:hypothetical protein
MHVRMHIRTATSESIKSESKFAELLSLRLWLLAQAKTSEHNDGYTVFGSRTAEHMAG